MEFRSVESTHCIIVDDATGLPAALLFSASSGGRRVRIEAVVECEVDGSERRSPTGGIDYVDTFRLSDCVRASDPTIHETPNGRTCRVPVRIGGAAGEAGVAGEFVYSLNRLGPACSLAFDFVGAQTLVVRNLVLRVFLDLGGDAWSVTAPGNMIAGATPLDAIASAVGISPMGGLRGSSGLVHLEPANHGDSAVSIVSSSSTVGTM